MIASIWRKKNVEIEIEEAVLLLQEENEWARDEFIKKYESLIKVFTSNVCKRYVDASDEEYSIGLLAFNEAIDQFKIEHNKKFLGFAEIVVRRRVIDYIRKEKRNQNRNVLLDSELFEEEITPPVSMERYGEAKMAEERKEEIDLFEHVLKSYGLSFEELTRVSPKHKDARIAAKEIAEFITENEELKYSLLEKKVLPMKELLARTKVSRSTLERQRKYIISLVLLMSGDYHYLKEFLPS